jgi:DNA-binding HxlR family transcriptional regulator
VQKDVNPETLAPALRLFHRRWSVPVVALLHGAGPLRFTDIAGELTRASRDTLAETLLELQAAGVIEKRVDGRYALTPAGEGLGDATRAAVEAVVSNDVLQVALKKWPIAVMVVVGRGAARFNEIKALLPGITSGALAPALKALEAAGLVERSVSTGYPPVTAYRLGAVGERLFPVMDHLVRTAAAVERAGHA